MKTKQFFYVFYISLFLLAFCHEFILLAGESPALQWEIKISQSDYMNDIKRFSMASDG